ncbi:MAG: AraC family ligand binding domain-containing protein [Clostridiales bacterium]|nr:AraC family ligand binding domain-containing protein [Clostridiales bacterium]
MADTRFEMREIEKGFKDFYENSSLDVYRHPVGVEEIRRTLKNGSEKYLSLFHSEFCRFLTEDNFFSEGEDIAVYQHYRYMPPLPHAHDFFEVAYVLSGNFYNYIGSKSQSLPLYPGDVLILAPNTTHAVYSCNDDSIMIDVMIRTSIFDEHFMKILPDNDLLHDFFVKTLYGSSTAPWLLFKTGEDEDLKDCALNIWREHSRNKMYKNTMMVSLVSIFLVTLLRNYEKDVIIPGMNPSVMNETTIFILQYMQKNYATITLAHLAEFFNYSERQMQ